MAEPLELLLTDEVTIRPALPKEKLKLSIAII